MRYALLAFAGGCLMALGIAGLALREAPRALPMPPPKTEATLSGTARPDMGGQPPAPTIPSTPCTPPFEIVASNLPATLGVAPGRGSVTVRVAPLPEGEHAFEVLVMVDVGFAGGTLAPSGPEVTGFLAGRAHPVAGPGQTITFDVPVPPAGGPVEVDGVPRGSRWDAVTASPRLGPPVLKGTSTQEGRVLRVDTNGRPPCVTTP